MPVSPTCHFEGVLFLTLSLSAGSKRPIFVVSDSDDSDDDLKMKNKRLKPSSPMTIHGSNAHSDSDRENDVQKQLNAIVSARKPDISRLNAFPFAPSTASNARGSGSINPSELKPRIDQLGVGISPSAQDVKPALNLPSGSATPAVSVIAASTVINAAGTLPFPYLMSSLLIR